MMTNGSPRVTRSAYVPDMSEAVSVEFCDCPRTDHVGSVDGHCTRPSIRSEESGDSEVDFSRYTECGSPCSSSSCE